MKRGEIVKSKVFSLVEGTHALEILNPRLDSSLLEDGDPYDCSEPRSIQQVDSIMNDMLKALMTWMNNNPLATSVLSCHYIVELILKYMESPSASMDNLLPVSSDSQETLLVNKTLKVFAVGVIKFVGFMLAIGQAGVLYDEEDINTQSLNLDYLSLIPYSAVQEAIVAEISRYSGSKEKRFDNLIAFLRIIHNLLQLPDIMLQKFDLFDNSGLNTEFLDQVLENVSQIKSAADIGPSPLNCFSARFQKVLSVKVPPRPVVLDSHANAYHHMEQMVLDLKQVFKATEVSNGVQLYEQLYWFMNSRNDELMHCPKHVLPRGLLQLFLIRDDKTVLGTEPFAELLLEDLNSLTSYGSAVLNQLHTPGDVSEKILQVMSQMEEVYFAWYCTVSQNPCRQRQHYSKGIKLWDTVQVNAENLELELENIDGVCDFFEISQQDESPTPVPIPTMPMSSWVYLKKLEAMVEVALRGIELEIHKPWEMFSVYWFAAYLCDNLKSHLHRIKIQNDHQIQSVHSINKRIKKLKAGEKKQKLRDLYNEKFTNDLPALTKVARRVDGLFTKYDILKRCLEFHSIFYAIMGALNIVSPPKMLKVSLKSLYELRFKPFSSVGVPQLPSYNQFTQYCDSMAPFKDITQLGELNRLKAYVGNLQKVVGSNVKETNSMIEDTIKDIKEDPSFKNCMDICIGNYKKLARSNVVLNLNFSRLCKLINKEGFTQRVKNGDFKIDVQRNGYHEYFPSIIPQ